MTMQSLQLFPDKLAEFGTTIFTVMSELANKHGAINLSQGFPNFPVDGELIGLVNKHMREGKNQYAPMAGVADLRQKISDKVLAATGTRYAPDLEITVTAGATQAIFTAVAATISPGDEVIMFAPAYDCYAPAVRLYGGIPVFIDLIAPEFKVDWEAVRSAVTPRTRLIIVNTPHNPSATVWTKADMLQLGQILDETDILLISDEVYEHIIFDGVEHWSAARFDALAARTFLIASFGKTFHATGWKAGYVCAPEALMSRFRKIHQYLVFSVNTPVQYALADYLEEPARYQSVAAFYQAKRDLFLDALQGSRFTCLPAQGAYFQVLDYRAISDELEADFARRLTIESKVAAIPLSGFYPKEREQHILRFCFAKTDETILQAAEILRNL